MATIRIDVKKDICLGHTVFRGSVRTNELAPAMWIDFHDEELNPYGYQRPYNTKRSQEAADYATSEEKSFWPESILAIRDNSEVDENADKVHWEFVSILGNPDSDFGTLIVEYNENRTENIGGQEVKWRRAFSQVDCQHRLGHMDKVDRYATVCIIPDITRLEEALIFRTINDTQKKISTSLVDAIVLLSTKSELEIPELHWAFNLGIDVGSSLYKLVSSEGTNIKGLKYLVTLRTLKNCASSLVGGKRIIRKRVKSEAEYYEAYLFLRNYWNTIASLWPTEFRDNVKFKLMTVPGLKGLSRYGRGICQKALDEGNTTQDFIRAFFEKGAHLIDWSTSGPFRDATGNAGARVVFDGLVQKYGVP